MKTTSDTRANCENTSFAAECKGRTECVNRVRYALCGMLLGVFGCTGAVVRYPYDKEPDPLATEYVIGVSDELAVSVWKNRELDAKLAVRPDGNITLPLVGDVLAAGKTPSELRRTIGDRLAAFVRDRDAAVTVAVVGVNSYFVTVAGNVVAPGRIAARTYLTVADAIALAGGPNRFATAAETLLLRRTSDGRLRRIPVDYERITAGQRLEENLVLLRGDRLYVP
jgi:polysaccharide export outer membrane protein